MDAATSPITVFWFRRDLRLEDNHGFFRALDGPHPVLPVFIFDPAILEELDDRRDKRVAFIHQALAALSEKLASLGSTIYTAHGEPVRVFAQLIGQYAIAQVISNHDFEPYAIRRDRLVAELLTGRGIRFSTFKDQVIFDPMEILKPDGTPYVVYTAYSKAWKQRLGGIVPPAYDSEKRLSGLMPHEAMPVPALADIGFERVDPGLSPIRIDPEMLMEYVNSRNFPYREGTTNVSVHLRFGTISVRHLVALALRWSETWLNELIWREFFMMILYFFPHVVDRSFKRKYDDIRWRNNEEEFAAWCDGATGYPLVDAGMRELNATGRMHNRVRMAVASFLTKDLLIDWRWGEAYFAKKLLDYELSSNNGNWQWAAGTGCDAAPYFRIFNPAEQARKFDPDSLYIQKWIPGCRPGYTPQIVDHAFARDRALAAYKVALEGM
ncbi:MAG TPA: deoxyribodipyrimidine photo-lyase [Puia sp.]|nr:deoxyribodipyrimidine photo-lyase [Puia sp.]